MFTNHVLQTWGVSSEATCKDWGIFLCNFTLKSPSTRKSDVCQGSAVISDTRVGLWHVWLMRSMILFSPDNLVIDVPQLHPPPAIDFGMIFLQSQVIKSAWAKWYFSLRFSNPWSSIGLRHTPQCHHKIHNDLLCASRGPPSVLCPTSCKHLCTTVPFPPYWFGKIPES